MNSYLSNPQTGPDSSGLPIASIVAALKNFTYRPETLPLNPDRKPFGQVSDELCARIAREALTVSERRGRLTDVVRQVAGCEIDEPVRRTTIETHVGLVAVDPGLVAGLLALGFEPHDFAGEQPTGYQHNFTQQFVLDRSRGDHGRLGVLLRRRSEEAKKLVQGHPGATGFIESETYTGEYDVVLPDRPLEPGALDRFPHDALAYREVAVPTTAAEAAVSGVPIDSRRAADVHVKIPGHFVRHAARTPAEQIAEHERSRDPAGRRLGDCLRAIGFYQQISHSGNFLYTAHFGELGESNRTFRELTRFAAEHGGIVSVVREACTALWRTTTTTESGESRLAPVPPLLTGR
ncbi:hypothetical protein ACQPZF_25460 [Actinosynnema sp. CS-041913]|uniref:hypothetical protein n=1 Tax=Actinosynnema sp. CS-041913 TaxID=3239917 RepID=UPI003D8C6F75